MKLLLDTHIAFWLATDRASLSEAEWRELNNSDNQLSVSAVAIWELRLKWNSLNNEGKPKGPIDPVAVLNVIEQLDIPVLPLEPRIAAKQLSVPMEHKDPFDELLLVCAQELEMKLFTRDRKLIAHPIAYAP